MLLSLSCWSFQKNPQIEDYRTDILLLIVHRIAPATISVKAAKSRLNMLVAVSGSVPLITEPTLVLSVPGPLSSDEITGTIPSLTYF